MGQFPPGTPEEREKEGRRPFWKISLAALWAIGRVVLLAKALWEFLGNDDGPGPISL